MVPSQSALPLKGWHGFAHSGDTALGIGKGAVFFQKRSAGQKYMGKFGGLVKEDILHHQTFHGAQCCLYMLGIGVGLGYIFALAV